MKIQTKLAVHKVDISSFLGLEELKKKINKIKRKMFCNKFKNCITIYKYN